MLRKYIIYLLISPSQKKYIGLTGRSLKKRLQDHMYEAKTKNRKIHKALRKYPLSEWQVHILEQDIDTLENAKIVEQKYIAKYNTASAGYNLSKGGEGGYGCQRTEETKEKIRNAKRNNPWRWKDHPELLAAKIQKQIGRKQPESQKLKVSLKLSKKHKVIFPDGHIEEIFNLLNFCKKHNLSGSNIYSASGSKGFKLIKQEN